MLLLSPLPMYSRRSFQVGAGSFVVFWCSDAHCFLTISIKRKLFTHKAPSLVGKGNCAVSFAPEPGPGRLQATNAATATIAAIKNKANDLFISLGCPRLGFEIP